MKMTDNKEKLITISQIYEILKDGEYMYKDKTVTKRTVRTMVDNGYFNSAMQVGLGNFWVVLESEVLNMVKE